jgi:hypothetical protein
LYIEDRQQAECVGECGAEGDLWPKREELTGGWRKYHQGWRKYHQEEPDCKYSRYQIKKECNGWDTWHIEGIGVCRVWCGELKARDHMEDQDIEGGKY